MESTSRESPSAAGAAHAIPCEQFGSSGPPTVFLHANGYPPGCYLPLLELLGRERRVLAMHQRPLWPGSKPEELTSWRPLSHDLLAFMDQRQLAVAPAVGHSLGAIVLLRAALIRPERFAALVLIDPVLFTPWVIASWSVARSLGIARWAHPWIATTERRRTDFDELELPFRGYRKRRVFRYLSDEQLRAHIAGMTRPRPGGYALRYSPAWETRIYLTGIWRDMDLWRRLPQLHVPCLFIRGAESDTFRPQALHRALRALPHATARVVERSTHLVPLERPDELSETIGSFLKEPS